MSIIGSLIRELFTSPVKQHQPIKPRLTDEEWLQASERVARATEYYKDVDFGELAVEVHDQHIKQQSRR